MTERLSKPPSPRSRLGSRQLRRTALREEAGRILGQVAVFLARSRITYPAGPPASYVRALCDMAEDDVVRGKAAWVLERRSRFLPVGPEGVILGCMHLSARYVVEERAAIKPQEVEKRRAKLIEAIAAMRAEAEATAGLGHREHALKLEAEAADIEAFYLGPTRESDPAIVVYRNRDEDSAEALARGILRTLARSLALLHGSPMTRVAAAFASSAAGAKVTRDQARLPAGRPAKRRYSRSG
jgi:hypothetical protein